MLLGIPAYASAIVLISKKGDVKICVDYRVLKPITVKDTYPLTLVSGQFYRLAEHVITLNLT